MQRANKRSESLIPKLKKFSSGGATHVSEGSKFTFGRPVIKAGRVRGINVYRICLERDVSVSLRR